MLEIYSPSGKEESLSAFLREELINLGFSNVHQDEVRNIYGEVGEGSPAILLCGHMDTVPGWISVKIEDGKIHGRGAVDAKSSLAAMIIAAYQLGVEGLVGKVIVAGVVDEERSAKGIRRLIHKGMKIDCAIFGEPSGISNITFAYKGRLAIKIRCRSEVGHIGAQHLYSNVIEEGYGLWNRLKEVFGVRRSLHGVFYSATPCLIGMRSSRSSDSMPDKCLLTVDVRLPPTFRSADGIDLVRKVISEYGREKPNISVDLVVTDRVEPFVANRNTTLMKALAKSIEEVLGRPPRFIKKTGTGDMNIFGHETGVPVATYGPGDGCLSHTKNEFLNCDDYIASIEVYKRAVRSIILEHEKRESL